MATQKSDVYAFGAVILELLSRAEPLKFRLYKKTGNFVRTSIMETARVAVNSDGGGVESRLKRWVDRKLKNSFSIEVAEKVAFSINAMEMEFSKSLDSNGDQVSQVQHLTTLCGQKKLKD